MKETYSYAYAENKGDGFELSHFFEKAGFVYIRVHDRDGHFNVNETYTLTVSGANPSYMPQETPVTVEAEPNNVIAAANLIVPETAVLSLRETPATRPKCHFGRVHRKMNGTTGKIRPAIFLDRDGTIIGDSGYIRNPSQVKFIRQSVPSLKRLSRYFQRNICSFRTRQRAS